MSDKKQKRVLGRGLDALLVNSSDDENKLKPPSNVNSFEIDINRIDVNPNQPRSNFDSKEIDSLCLLYTSPSPRDVEESRMPSSA